MPRREPYPRHPHISEVPRIPAEEITLLWYASWYDGPLDGAASWKGKRYWYKAIFEYRVDDYEGVYELIDLPDSEWEIIDRREDVLRAYVGDGHVFDYATGKLLPGKENPNWEGFFADPEIAGTEREYFIPQGVLVGTFRLWGSDPEPKKSRRKKKGSGTSS